MSSIFFLWPALAAASAMEAASTMAAQFAHLAGATESPPELDELEWTTPSRIALELPSVRLRKFLSEGEAIPTVICAPYALHHATIVDFAHGHSLVGALVAAGLKQVFATEWRSATPEMRYLSIDNYLADLNVIVDELGGHVNLIGMCQGGWMALVYSARFPGKVRELVLAGAPIDISAGHSELSRRAASVPVSVFKQLTEIGGGRIRGGHLSKVWNSAPLNDEAIRNVLQLDDFAETCRARWLIDHFREWHTKVLDLPGIYYVQVAECLYLQNQLATGRFIALGRRINLSEIDIPIYLLAARNDDIVAPEQLFAVENLVGTKGNNIRKKTAACGHLGLFMGSAVLKDIWPVIARQLSRQRVVEAR